ncbi:hypothetical protein [Mucilaginibacter rubeus]|uniref:DUF1273 domain-containing protein n=1 Tax=Mucilaginibacter rubeus TaxID=2027860 RepID=A0A5C1HSV0_9SPHI|nr:hypothetical protein [Mucilaginibacter rubeus]QEM08543.1 hypothetical protein DEO27_000410 [Mucilaginibacter rubeus]
MTHYILFTGHMIDKAGRPKERFPAYKEHDARIKIKDKLSEAINNADASFMGIAGGACGGDILFHELCIELGIPSTVYLALPPAEFKKASVSFAGQTWDERFDHLLQVVPFSILAANEDKSLTIWEQANLWMLDDALKSGGENMNLIALWDGQGGDDKGGTQHMVEKAREMSADVEVVRIDEI